MNRKEFLKISSGFGLVCGCAGGLASAVPDKQSDGTPSALTPCDEKVTFTKGWVKRFFDVMDGELDEKTRKKIMEMNGKACYSLHYKKGSRKKLDMDIDTYVKRLAEYVGKENCYREGSKVIFTYVKNPRGLKIEDGYCLCPMVEDGPKDLSASFCYCSVGYVKEMFSRVLPQPPRVELLASLRRGDKRCRFEIHVNSPTEP